MFRKLNPLLLVTTLLMPISTWAIELTDYTTVDSFYQEAFVNSQFNLRSGNQDQTSIDGNATGNYDITYSTLPFVWGIRGDGKLDINRGKNEGSSTEKGYDFLLHGNADKYFNPEGLLLGYGSFDLGYRKPMGVDDADDPFAKMLVMVE